jgi:hypothetical protein
MAKRRESADSEPQKPAKPKRETEKLNATVDGETLWRFEILCATLGVEPRHLLQELMEERLNGQKLPPGAKYVPPSQRKSAEKAAAESESGEAT